MCASIRGDPGRARRHGLARVGRGPEALCLAADDCRELWRADDVRRRVVLALEAPWAEPVGTEDPTLVVVADAVSWTRVAAVHADLAETDATAEEDLCWFATQEVGQLLLPHGLGGTSG